MAATGRSWQPDAGPAATGPPKLPICRAYWGLRRSTDRQNPRRSESSMAARMEEVRVLLNKLASVLIVPSGRTRPSLLYAGLAVFPFPFQRR